MKKTKKILALVLAAVMLVCTTVAATVAYLTANTGVVNNTFTVGNVAIELDETDVDLYGVKDTNTRVKANTYKLIPGHTYVKDPTVHVTEGSEECYVFVKVVVANKIAGLLDGFAINSDWVELDGVANVYYYKDKVDARAATEKVSLTPVFTQFKVLNNADVSGVTATDTITIDAYAVQADGFADAAAAWAAAPTTWIE